MVVSAIIGLTPFTNVHVTQMKVQTCEFRYDFVPVSKMLGAEEGKYRYWKIKQIPAEKPSEDNLKCLGLPTCPKNEYTIRVIMMTVVVIL